LPVKICQGILAIIFDASVAEATRIRDFQRQKPFSLSAYATCTTERTFLWWFLSMGDPQTMGFPLEISTLDDFQVPQVERNTLLIHIVGMLFLNLDEIGTTQAILGFGSDFSC
jgi:hypothetical protein